MKKEVDPELFSLASSHIPAFSKKYQKLETPKAVFIGLFFVSCLTIGVVLGLLYP
jgi:hypothetical protein